jgi:RNA polymerase sigma-B factor
LKGAPLEDKNKLIIQYYKDKSPKSKLRDQIMVKYKSMVEYIARKLAFNREDLDDLIQVGSIALLKSLERFDPSKDIDFATFATPNIIGEIKHYFRDKSNIVKIPRKLQEMQSRIKREVTDLQSQGLSLSIPQIAEKLNLKEEDILEAMEASYTSQVVSLDAPTYTQSLTEQDSESSIADTLKVEGLDHDVITKMTLKESLAQLPDRERKIIQMRFYSGLSQSEIADRTGLSQMHISRLLQQSLASLKKILTHSL